MSIMSDEEAMKCARGVAEIPATSLGRVPTITLLSMIARLETSLRESKEREDAAHKKYLRQVGDHVEEVSDLKRQLAEAREAAYAQGVENTEAVAGKRIGELQRQLAEAQAIIGHRAELPAVSRADLRNKIADLERQLAESEAQLESAKSRARLDLPDPKDAHLTVPQFVSKLANLWTESKAALKEAESENAALRAQVAAKDASLARLVREVSWYDKWLIKVVTRHTLSLNAQAAEAIERAALAADAAPAGSFTVFGLTPQEMTEQLKKLNAAPAPGPGKPGAEPAAPPEKQERADKEAGS